jgi:hypothetical protein
MKANTILFSVVLAMTLIANVSSEFDLNEPQKTLRNWINLNEYLIDSNSEAVSLGGNCLATDDQVRALFFMKELFDGILESEEGMLERTWPYAKYYAQELGPLLSLKSNETCKPSNENIDIVVCFKNKCSQCLVLDDDEAAKVSDGDLKSLCEKIKIPDSSFPHLGETEPDSETSNALQTLKDAREYSSSLPPEKIRWEDLDDLQKLLKEKTKERLEVCSDNVPMARAAQMLWEMYRLKDSDTTDQNDTVGEAKVKTAFEAHPEYYHEHLGVLKLARPEDITCKWGTFCGPDGLCSDCRYHGIPEAFDGACKFDSEARNIDITEWERRNIVNDSTIPPVVPTTVMPTGGNSRQGIQPILVTLMPLAFLAATKHLQTSN